MLLNTLVTAFLPLPGLAYVLLVLALSPENSMLLLELKESFVQIVPLLLAEA
jgi:hypothetical protein